MDLLEVYRPGRGLGLRKAGVLISYLPPESATATAMRNDAAKRGVKAGGGEDTDPAEGQWSLQEMLTASVIDELRWFRHDFRSANSDERQQAPSPVPRPGVKSAKKKSKMTRAQAMMLDPRMRGEWPNG